MKSPLNLLALSVSASALLIAQAAAVLSPNGDFETPGGATWTENSDGGTYNFSYPPTEGNPGGHGIIDNTAADGGFGIWVANDDEIITLATLGLTPGAGFVFSQDMKIIAGDNIGGFKVDFFKGADLSGSTGDMYPALIGDGSTWETYTFTVIIPAKADGIKIVPLWGPGSSVGYDNICVDPTPIPQPLVPNGDFESGSAAWLEIGTDTGWDYADSGGNPDGYGVITNGGAENSFGIWVANGGAPLPLDCLGLSGGQMVCFLLDMTILAGENIGGLKIEFLNGTTLLDDTGDMRPDLIGDGSTWETYSFDVALPANADHIKIVPLWGSASTVGYDNVRFRTMAPPLFMADIQAGTVFSWGSEGDEFFYQLQESYDEIEWDDIGPLIEGESFSSIFSSSDAPFFRIQILELVATDAVLNGGFETEGGAEPDCAESWTCFSPPNSNQPPTRITTDFRSGSASMRIAVINDASATPNKSELQQNITNAGGMITPGETYEFSFWAKQISSGVSYVQQHRVQWLDDVGAIVGEAGFTNFTGGDGVWEKITVPDLVAPNNAVTAFIQIFGATGAVPGIAAEGEVLIDDLMLGIRELQEFDTTEATPAPGVEVSWETENGVNYQVQASPNGLEGFVNFGPVISGDGEKESASDLISEDSEYYRVVEMKP